MKYFIIIIILILIFFIISRKESFVATIPITDIYTDDKIPLVINGMLRDTHHLLDKYNIPYWSESNKTFISRKDEIQFTRLLPILHKIGYNLVNHKGIYKIYPLNGISVRSIDKSIYNNDNDDDINYKFPYIGILII